MLDYREETLPKEAEDKLRLWLTRPEEWASLVKILQSDIKRQQIKALQTGMEHAEHPNKIILTEAHMDKARRYLTCLEVLQELRDRKDAYLLVKPL